MVAYYTHLTALERNTLQSSLNVGLSCRVIAQSLGRSVSTIMREIKRCGFCRQSYDAGQAGALLLRRRRRGSIKLREGTPLRTYVLDQLAKAWSPEQIAGTLKKMNEIDVVEPLMPRVSHETIYRMIYILPRGEIRRELIGFLRQSKTKRGLRTVSRERRGGLVNMMSIHDRPQSVADRAIAGDWEGDFVKGAFNASAIGTLIERKSRYTILARMKDCGAEAALEGFTRVLKRVPNAMRKTLTYDQGKEMARHAELADKLKIKVYFCDPHSPWQRPSNENMNGLVRQYLPKGCDLSIYSQRDLYKIAESLNTRPRKCLGFSTPKEVFEAEIAKNNVALQM